MALARNRKFIVSADGAANQTGWLTLRKGGVVTLEGTFVATVTLERLDAYGNIVAVTDNSGGATTFTLPGTYTIDPASTAANYRLNCQSGDFTSGPMTMMIEGF